MHNPLNIFDYHSYREFLKIWLVNAKKARRSNLSQLAEAAQVHPTFLSHVLAGSKELSLEQAMLISEYLPLTRLEQDFFFVLLNIERAGNKKLQNYWLEKKKILEQEKNKLSERFEKHKELTSEQRATFYSSWIYSAIWVSTAIEGGRTLAEIAEQFHLSRNVTEEILSFLVRTGICAELKGVFTMGETHVHIPNESPHVTKHHVNWRMKGIQRLDSRDSTELFFTAPMSIAKKDFGVLRERLTRLIQESVELAKASKAEELACLNIDFFKPSA